jgi:hypothetical protein
MDQYECLRKYIETNYHKKVTLGDMKLRLLSQFPSLVNVSMTTIAKKLNHNLKMVYKKVSIQF